MIAIVQLRGEVNMRESVRDTLSMLNLHRVNHATLVPETDTYRGMITKVTDYVAYGGVDEAVLADLLERRAEPLEGDRPDGNDWLAAHTDHDGAAALAAALLAEETTLREVGLSPTLRLHPPRGGHEGVKHPAGDGGQLGRHTTDQMNALLESMR